MASLEKLVSANPEPLGADACGTMDSGPAEGRFASVGAIAYGQTFCDGAPGVDGLAAVEFNSSDDARQALAKPELLDSPEAVNVADRMKIGDSVCLAQRDRGTTKTTCATPVAQYIVLATGTDGTTVVEGGSLRMVDWVQSTDAS